MPPKYISLKQAAVQLGLSSSSLRRKIADGVLEAYRLNPRGKILIKPSQVEALLTADRPDAFTRASLKELVQAAFESVKAEQKSVQQGISPVLH